MFGNYLATLNLYLNNNTSSTSQGVLGNQQGNYAFAGLFRDPSAWYHCVIHKDNGVTSGFINGSEARFAYNATDLTIPASSQMAIGANTSDPLIRQVM